MISFSYSHFLRLCCCGNYFFLCFRYVMHDSSVRRKRKEEDADLHLAQKIMQSKQYNMSSCADDEYDFDDAPSRKTRKKEGGNGRKLTEKNNFANRILTQQERCQFCFKNPTRPRHLVVVIANFTYLMLPHWQPVVPGRCCILPMQASFTQFLFY